MTAKHAEQGNADLGPQDAETTARSAALMLRLATAALGLRNGEATRTARRPRG